MDHSRSITRRTFVAAGAAALAAAAAPLPRASAQGADEVVIIHTNDMHGYLRGDGSAIVGIDYVAGLRAQYPDALLVDAGDATQGAPLASLTKGSAVIGLMNSAGYDAMCLGNHEFDYGLDVLAANVGAADFPMLGANAVLSDGTPVTAGIGASGNGCSVVLESAGRRIGVFGLTTTATAWSVMPERIRDVSFRDEVATAEEQIASLSEQGVDAIVCLAHLGDGNVPCKAVELVELLSDAAAASLTAIVDGHSHTVENAQVRGVAVVQTGCHLGNVGKLVLSFSDEGVSAAGELLDAAAVLQVADASAEVTTGLEQVAAQQQEILGVQVCPNPTTLWGGKRGTGGSIPSTRIVETNLGDLTCDAMRQAAREYLDGIGDAATPVVGMCNGGGIRDSLPRGMLTRGDFVTAFPFANTIMVKYVSPAMLKGLFEVGLASANGQDPETGMLLQTEVSGSFRQLSGATVVADPGQVVGQRVVSITLDGCDEPLDLSDQAVGIAVVSNSYVMTGGDYGEIGDVELLAEIGGDVENVEGYVVALAGQCGGVLPLLGGNQRRMQYRGGYEPAPWEARVLVVDAGQTPVAGQAVRLQIDGADVVETVTDEQGFAVVAVEDGPHGIAVAPADDDPAARVPEVIVDNYMGLGLVQDEYRPWPTLVLA